MESNKLLQEILGKDKLQKLYNYSKEDYEIINYFFCEKNRPSKIIIEQLKKAKIEDIKSICDSFTINLINNQFYKINIEEYPKKFIEENKKILLINTDIPYDVKVRYYKKELTIEDVIKYINYFENIPIEKYMDYNYDIETMTDKIGTDNFKIIINKYPKVLQYIINKNEIYNFCQYIKNTKENIEKNFIKTVKNYFVFNIYDEEFKTEINGKIKYNIPTWIEELNLEFKEEFKTLDDILNYNERTIILDVKQQAICELIDILNIENIRKLEEEIHYFSHKNYNDSEELDMIYNIVFFYKRYKMNFQNKDIPLIEQLDFKNGTLNYQEFRYQFAKLLNIMRIKKINNLSTNYDWIKSQFRKDNQEFFINENYPLEIKKAFYENEITSEFIFKHQEYIEIIKNDLSKLICTTSKIKKTVYNIITDCYETKQISFAQEYINKYGNEKYIPLIKKYGIFLDKLLLMDIDINNEIELEKIIRKEIYKIVKITKINYMFLENNQEFVKEYPNIFISLDELTINQYEKQRIKKDFYDRKLNLNDIKNNPNIIDILKNKNIDIIIENTILKKFGKNIFLTLSCIYGRYLNDIDERIKQIDFNETINIEQLKNIIENIILDECLEGRIIYLKKDAPNFLLKHEELFLDDDAPKNLKQYFYGTNDKKLNFFVLSKYPNWLQYLKNKNIIPAFIKTMKNNMEIKKYFKLFGENALILGISKPETVTEMIRSNNTLRMLKWYEKTNKKFVPDYIVMKNLPTNDIDKYLKSIKIWSRFAKLEEYNQLLETKDALLKIAYVFGVFDDDKKGINTLYNLLTEIPKKIKKEDGNIIEEIDFFGNQYIKNQSQTLPFDGIDYIKLKNTLKEEGYQLKNENILTNLYRKNSDNSYTLTINQQSYQKSCKIIRKIFENYTNIIRINKFDIHKIFSSFELKYDNNFEEFLIKNLDIFLNNPTYLQYLPRIQKNFQEIKLTNTNRSITATLALSYVKNNTYKNIDVGNEELSRICQIAGYIQQEFDTLQQIYNFTRKRTFSSIPRIEGKTEKYIYRILSLQNPKAATIGTLTNCCQEIDSTAETCMEHSLTSKDGGIFEIRDKKGQLIAQSWIWRNNETLCFDNIEVSDRQMWKHGIEKGKEDMGIRNKFTDEILEIYKIAAKKIVTLDRVKLKDLIDEKKITVEQYKNLKLKKITVGIGFSNIKGSIKLLEEDDLNITPKEYIPPVKLKNQLYLNDSKKQYILVKTKEPLMIKNINSVYPYYDEFIEYSDNNFDELKLFQLVKLAQATNHTLYINADKNFVTQIAYNYQLNPVNTRIILTPNFSIIYEKNSNNIKIGDIIFIKIIKNSSKEINIEKEVLIQISLALKQISINKKIDLSNVYKFVEYLSENNIEEEMNKEQGYCLKNKKSS